MNVLARALGEKCANVTINPCSKNILQFCEESQLKKYIGVRLWVIVKAILSKNEHSRCFYDFCCMFFLIRFSLVRYRYFMLYFRLSFGRSAANVQSVHGTWLCVLWQTDSNRWRCFNNGSVCISLFKNESVWVVIN